MTLLSLTLALPFEDRVEVDNVKLYAEATAENVPMWEWHSWLTARLSTITGASFPQQTQAAGTKRDCSIGCARDYDGIKSGLNRRFKTFLNCGPRQPEEKSLQKPQGTLLDDSGIPPIMPGQFPSHMRDHPVPQEVEPGDYAYLEGAERSSDGNSGSGGSLL